MTDYISREAAIAETRNPRLTDAELRRRLALIPAADVVEVVHGEWIATEMYAIDKCSKCGFLMDWDDVPAWLRSFPFFKITCPNCGAKMDGKRKDGDAV